MFRVGAKKFATVARRNFSAASKEEAGVEGVKWAKITYGMIGLCVVGMFWEHFTAVHHVQEVTGLSYQKIRNKPFPWKECPDCDFFDGKCWRACRGESSGHH